MRALIVVLAFLYALAVGVPSVLYLTGFYGTLGVVRAGAGAPVPTGDLTVVASIAPGSAAAGAGIVVGDRIVRAGTEHVPPFEIVMDKLPAGHPVPFSVVHQGTTRTVALTPRAVRPAPARSAIVIALLARGAIIALIGALLALLRPSVMTGAFFFLCLAFSDLAHAFGNLEVVATVPLFWKPLALALTCVIQGGGVVAAAIFCMRFPSGEPLPSWRWVEKAMLALGIGTIGLYCAALYAGGTYSDIGSRLYGVFTVIAWFGFAVAVAAFMVRYAHASGEDRARLRWVAIGLGSFLASFALLWYAENDASAPADFSLYAQFVNVLPLTVLYAVVRHRVIDVRVAGGRALAFGLFSAVPVVGFSLLDWGLSNGLQSSKIALVTEMCVAVGFGFWVNSSQRRIDGLIESVFFRSRMIAEERLRRVARRLAHASAEDAVDETLAREPYEALRLVAAAVYHRREDRFARVAQRGWPAGALPEMDANDSLALELIATGEPVDVKSIAWEHAASIAALRPSLAVPICVRRNTIGFLLLGEKMDGERFDALEQAAVREIAEAAANAYDHLEAEAQRKIAADLRHALDDAIRETETLRALLPREASGA